jgi:hypothetical protein
MLSNDNTSSNCKWCGVALDATHIGPCPSCGKEGKDVKVHLSTVVTAKSSLSWEKRREYFESNKRIRNILINLTIISPFIGLVLKGLIGLFVGFAVSILLFFLGPYALMKVREIERGRSS